VNRLLDEEVEETSEEQVEETSGYGEPFDVSLVAKALVLFGLVILVIYLVLRYLAVTTYADGSWMVWTLTQPGAFEGVVAITCIFIFFGLIAYLIHIQFMKLAVIAEEVIGAQVVESVSEEETLESEMEQGA